METEGYSKGELLSAGGIHGCQDASVPSPYELDTVIDFPPGMASTQAGNIHHSCLSDNGSYFDIDKKAAALSLEKLSTSFTNDRAASGPHSQSASTPFFEHFDIHKKDTCTAAVPHLCVQYTPRSDLEGLDTTLISPSARPGCLIAYPPDPSYPRNGLGATYDDSPTTPSTPMTYNFNVNYQLVDGPQASSYYHVEESVSLPPFESPGRLTFIHSMPSPSSATYQAGDIESLQFPWPTLEVLKDLHSGGHVITPEVDAKVSRGMLRAPLTGHWTCYRRNYVHVDCSFTLKPTVANVPIEVVERDGTRRTVQAFGMHLSAAVDGFAGKAVELVRYTTKRDKADHLPDEIVHVAPAPASVRVTHSVTPYGLQALAHHPSGSPAGPQLPLQSSTASVVGSGAEPSGRKTSHTFGRIQFKQATANNGRRRASQQFFHLIIELWADVRKTKSDPAEWVIVAKRISEKLTVRGRSPSHYRFETLNGKGRRRPSSGASSGSGSGDDAPGHAYREGYTMNRPGQFRPSADVQGSPSTTTNSFTPVNHNVNISSDTSACSPAVLGGDVTLQEHGIGGLSRYSYHAKPIYEQQSLRLPPLLTNLHSAHGSRDTALKIEYPNAVPGPLWSVDEADEMTGVATSRGYYPESLQPIYAGAPPQYM